jgi:hypothetical protein
MTTALSASTEAPYIGAIHVDSLFADSTYQRDLDEPRVRRMADELDLRLLGVLEVSRRDDGRHAILDGQHRWAAARLAHPDGSGAHLVCQIHSGLTVEDEARVFYEVDARRKNLTWWDRWRARRGAGDERVVAIDAVLERHQLQINPTAADGNLRATKAVETIVDELGDLVMLDRVLVVLTSAFGRSFDAFDGSIMQGLAFVLGNYDADELDLDRLVVQLREIPPRQLRARAASMREAHRGTLPRLCAAVIVERYNSGRGRRLEDFLVRIPSTSKAGVQFNRDKRARAEIRRWAERNGYDLTGHRNIPPRVRRAYEEAQVAASAAVDVDNRLTDVGYAELPAQTRRNIQQAMSRGMTITWVMDAYDVDYPTVKAIRDDMAA